MLAQLAVPFRDTSAADLLVAVHAGADAPPGLRAMAAASGAFVLELRVLGASHAVIARVPDGRALTEVVACDAPAGAPLTGGVRLEGGLRHSFTATVEHGDVAARADELRALAGTAGALVAAFPGQRDALTAVCARPGAGAVAVWETWHLYPGAGELVRTTTTLAVAA